MQGLQVDGGVATPPNEPDTFADENVDYSTVFITQVDGADEEGEDGIEDQIENQTAGRQIPSILIEKSFFSFFLKNFT